MLSRRAFVFGYKQFVAGQGNCPLQLPTLQDMSACTDQSVKAKEVDTTKWTGPREQVSMERPGNIRL